MSQATISGAGPAASEKSETRVRPIHFRNFWLGIAVITLVYGAVRVYQGLYAWETGLDSLSAEFQLYWYNFLFGAWALIIPTGVAVWLWLYASRDKAIDQVEPQEELRRYVVWVTWLCLYAFAFFWSVSVFGEQDAAWHQTAVRDTVFTPSHIVLFFISMPIYIFIGVGSLIYARTRIPIFSKGYSLPYIIVISGPFMILVTEGFNEWAHSFWILEELFSAPVHWGFAILGWSVLALFGVLMTVLPRLNYLLGEVRA